MASGHSSLSITEKPIQLIDCVCEIPMVEIPLAMFEGKFPTPHYSATPSLATK